MNKTSDPGVIVVIGLLCLILLLNIVEAIMLDGLRDNLEEIRDSLTEFTTIPETEDDVTNDSQTTPDTTPSIPSVEETIPPTINSQELELLACVIYQEAGWDLSCDDCRRRVADVVLNRMADPRFPNTMQAVLTEKDQYGKYYWTGVIWPEDSDTAYAKPRVERAYRIAREVLSGQHSELYGKGYIWQASFIQGKDNIYCCGIYFGR